MRIKLRDAAIAALPEELQAEAKQVGLYDICVYICVLREGGGVSLHVYT